MVRLWDARTGQLLERFDGHKDSVYSVAFSSDGKSIVSGSLDKTLKIWDISPPVLSYLAATAHIDLSEDGQPPDSFPRFEALVTTTCRHTFAGHKDFVLSVAYGAVFPSLPPQSEDECREWVVSGSKDRTVTFWDARGESWISLSSST
jgi:glucose repression regulatory protein TUP1